MSAVGSVPLWSGAPGGLTQGNDVMLLLVLRRTRAKNATDAYYTVLSRGRRKEDELYGPSNLEVFECACDKLVIAEASKFDTGRGQAGGTPRERPPILNLDDISKKILGADSGATNGSY